MGARRVIVVGAGMAGLGSAWRLAAAGFEVRVFERGPRPGGRMWSERREGFTLEPGARTFWSGDRNLRRLLAEVGQDEQFVPIRSGGLGQVHGGWIREIGAGKSRGFARLPGDRPLSGMARLERLVQRFGSGLDPSRPERAAPLDDRSIGDFGRLYFGERALSRWMEPFAAGAALCDVEQASRVLFLHEWTARRGATPALLRSGAGTLGEALARRLEVHCGAEVSRVEAGAPGGTLVQFREAGVEGTIGADAAVIATPAGPAADLAADLLCGAERAFLAATRYAPALTVMVAAQDPLFPRLMRIRVPRIEGGAIQSITVEPGRHGGRVPDGCALVTLTARPAWSEAHLAASDDAVAKELLVAAVRLVPALRDRVRFTAVARHPLAMARFGVGRYRALERFQRVQRSMRQEGRRVYFAGDYLAGPSVEAALTSGLRAAEAVMADLGV